MKKLFTSPWALLCAIALLRLPGFVFGVLNIDESDFLVFGAAIWKGLLPYRDFVEIKPPLGYFTYALGGGFDIWPIRVLGVFWVFATALVLRAAARRWTGSEEAGWAAAWLSLLASLVEVPAFGSEVMMNLPVAAALYFFARSRGARDLLACGICAGLATLYRHQAAVVPVALCAAVLLTRECGRKRAIAQTAAMAAGALGPWVLCAGLYAAVDQLPAFFEWTVARNLQYAAAGRAGSALARGAASIAVCLAAACLPWVLALRESFRPRRDVVFRGLTLLLWLTWPAVAAGGRFSEHYFLQFVPPLALLAAPGAADLIARRRELLPRMRTLALAVTAAPVVVWLAFSWSRGIAGAYPSQEQRANALGRWLRANSADQETVFVWGHYSPVFTIAHRLPGTRYVNTSVHMGNFDPSHLAAGFDPAAHRSRADIEATVSDLEERKPSWLVDTSPAAIHHWDRVPLSAFPELAHYRDEHYAEVARPGGAIVYRRRDAEPAREPALAGKSTPANGSQ